MRFFWEKYWPVIMLKLDLSDISSWLNIVMQTWPDWHRSDSVFSMQHIRRYMVSMYITVSYVNFVTWYYLLSFSTVNLIFLLILIKNIFCRDSLRLFLIILFQHFYGAKLLWWVLPVTLITVIFAMLEFYFQHVFYKL